MQSGTAYSQAGARGEACVDGMSAVQVADAVERTAGQFHAQTLEVGDGTVRDSLAAGLVDGRGARLDDHDRQARESGPDRGGRTGRTAARYQKIDHVTSADFSAASSVRI